MALVRKIGGITFAEQYSDVIVFEEFGYSLCKGTQTAFDCIKSGFCPFKEQGISNVIEYFLRARPPNMILTAVESVDIVSLIVEKVGKGETFPFITNNTFC